MVEHPLLHHHLFMVWSWCSSFQGMFAPGRRNLCFDQHATLESLHHQEPQGVRGAIGQQNAGTKHGRPVKGMPRRCIRSGMSCVNPPFFGDPDVICLTPKHNSTTPWGNIEKHRKMAKVNVQLHYVADVGEKDHVRSHVAGFSEQQKTQVPGAMRPRGHEHE